MVDNVRIPSDGAGKRVTTNVYNDGATDFHTQVINVGDRTDPNLAQTVSTDGAAWVEFPSGMPDFNAFGALMTASSGLLGAYKFYDGPVSIASIVNTNTTGTANVAFDSSSLSYNMSTSAGTGHSAEIGSHKHFAYKPGSGMLSLFVVSADDPGKINVTRQVGIFDDDDGLFFESTDGLMNVVVRDSTTATETRIEQDSWNGDRLNGLGGDNNRSGALLDFSKLNIFWVRYQYLSAGAIEFGTYIDGKAIVLHTISNYGTLNAPYMAKSKLPVRARIENVGPAIGTSDFRIHCAAVLNEGYPEQIFKPLSIIGQRVINTSDETYIWAARPSQTWNGIPNRDVYLPKDLSIVSSTDAMIIRVYHNPTLVNATYPNSALGVEWDTNSNTTLSGGSVIFSTVVGVGHALVHQLSLLLDQGTQGYTRHYNIAETDVLAITAERLTTNGNSTVCVTSTIHQQG